MERQTASDSGISRALLYAGAALTLFTIYQCYRVAHNVLLHPLRGFPGPFIQRASPLPFFYFHVTGSQIFRTQRLHDTYGPVVRIAPNHLSFTDPRAWRDIYAHRSGPGGHPFELPKSDIFYSANKSFPTSIANAGPEEHERIRGALAPGFSDAAMRRQEPVISGYVDLLVRRLEQNCNGGKVVLDIAKWFHWATFDIMGSLVFAQSFGCLEDSKAHPWVSAVMRFVKDSSKLTGLSYLGFHTTVEALSSIGMKYTAKYQAYVAKMLKARLAVKFERDDLFESLLQKRKEWDLGLDKLQVNASVLVLAGSETTATILSGVTYLLCKHPDTLVKATREVRSSFESSGQITLSSVNSLSYMLAALNEALRCYPPSSSMLVRVVPAGGLEIADRFIPERTLVEIQQWSMNHSKDNWEDPWEFRPERFVKGLGEGDKQKSLQPFNVGPRDCVGRNLAIVEMRLVLARILYAFDMKLGEDCDDWMDRQVSFALWSKPPLNVYLTPVASKPAS